MTSPNQGKENKNLTLCILLRHVVHGLSTADTVYTSVVEKCMTNRSTTVQCQSEQCRSVRALLPLVRLRLPVGFSLGLLLLSLCLEHFGQPGTLLLRAAANDFAYGQCQDVDMTGPNLQ